MRRRRSPRLPRHAHPHGRDEAASASGTIATSSPGLRTIHLGGHAPCSRAVVVETRSGPAIITSDEVYLYRLLEEAILPAIRTSEAAYEEATRRLVTLAEETGGVLVPLHDPAVWKAYEEHGDGWLEALRPLSERACAGYRRAGGLGRGGGRSSR